MIFSTPIFLFLFLPLVLTIYFILTKNYRNLFLLTSSLLFYAWGEGLFLLLMLVSITMNYFFALAIDKYRPIGKDKLFLWIAVASNLSLLGFFKYGNFVVDNINILLFSSPLSPFTSHFSPLTSSIILPLGISFFTFQALSYVIDVYTKKVTANRRFSDIALYISFFPQLIAGPIVRYHDIQKHLRKRIVTAPLFFDGASRFVVGLSKKIIIGDQLSILANTAFTYSPNEIPFPFSWIFMVIWAVHVYFDFSGYSDMAIGMGKMFGFTFPENFNYPYISKSIQEFWRRWHISLSTWLRDYLYFPLGGSKKGISRTYVNLFMVFVLCGLWHGAAWNFIIFGVFQGAIMVVERMGLEKFLNRIWAPLAHLYFFFAIIITFTLFALPDMQTIGAYLSSLFVPSPASELPTTLRGLFTPMRMAIFAIGLLFSLPVAPWAKKRLLNHGTSQNSMYIITGLITLTLFIVSVMLIAQNSYSPFLYFRF